MKNNIKIYEMPIFYLTIFLAGFGTVMLYSASITPAINKFGWDHHSTYLYKHISRLAISFIALFSIYKLDLSILDKYSKHILFLSWILIIWGYISTPEYENVRRTLFVFGKRIFTTSDFARIALIIFTASFINKHKKNINNLKILVKELIPYISISIFLILFQPDFSSSFAIGTIIISMLIVGGLSIKYLLKSSLIIALLSPIIIYKFPYMLSRITNWYSNSNNDEQHQSFRSIQALYNGGFFGQGIGNSIIKQGLIQEGHTDFILAVIGEELGFIGILFLFILFFTFYFQGIKISKSAPNIFLSMLALGISFNIIYYFLINAAYVVKIIPPTGLAMPFISYGGSHTIFTFISIGILMKISKFSNLYRKKYI